MLVGFEPYNKEWVVMFREAATRLRLALGEGPARIDHIGSTAVPGLSAKPVIDIQITLTRLGDHVRMIPAMEGLGYIFRSDIQCDRPPEWDFGNEREWIKAYFRTRDGETPRYHIHVREAGRRNQRYPLLMRDYLRANKPARGSYALYKERLREAVGHLSSAGGTGLYVDLKDPMFDLIAHAAERWAEEVGWSPAARDA